MSLAVPERVRKLAEIHWNLTARYMVKEEPMPAMRPQKAPLGVIHLTNMPRSMVAKSGALTQEKMACM